MTTPEGRNKTIITIVATFVLAIGAVAAAVMTGVISRSASVTEKAESTPAAPGLRSTSQITTSSPLKAKCRSQ